MVGGKGNGRSSDVEAEVLRARRARGAARHPGALVRREDIVRGSDFLELGEPLVLGDLGLAVEGRVGRLLGAEGEALRRADADAVAR